MSGASPSSDHSGRRRTDSSSGRPAYTLTACIRCRERKSKCDASLPRCTLCEKAGQQHCEYWDASKRMRLPRSHIVRLRTEVERLEAALAQYDIHDNLEPEEEELVRDAAVVEFRDTLERKFLGASSGTTMTRLVMRLAKQVLGAKSINDVISAERLRQIDAKAAQEEARPITKSADYPLVSSYAERKLPGKDLCNMLLHLYNTKVQSMYPLFHEATLPGLFDEVMSGTESATKNFIVLMILAISLQRLETKYAGIADSFYLGALMYFEEVVRAMNLETVQCCVLIGQYSLLTPTRTAAWYIVGLGVRLAQQLGLAEEHLIVRDARGQPETPYQVDLKRRAFWAIATMDYGLAHSLGRPASMATEKDHIDVRFFQRLDDEYIRPDGIRSGPPSIRKWIAIHFYNMRLLQLEMRRMLYLKKRPTPTSDADPWFKYMEKKLTDWKNATPSEDAGSGFSESWFKGRYHTMITLLFRPSPQVPRPSARAAILCYDACAWNVYMHRDQMVKKSVEMTWAWTQSVFMAVNTILWSLSYVEVRQRTSQEEVKQHLDIALQAMTQASERWPGVASAVELYEALISACLQIFDREGDIPLQGSPYADSEGGTKSLSPSPNLGHVSIPLTGLTRSQRPMFQPILPSNVPMSQAPSGNGPLPQAPLSNGLAPQALPSPGGTVSLTSPPNSFSTASGNAAANAYHAHCNNHYQRNESLAPPPMQYANTNSHFNSLPTTYAQLNNWHFSPATAAPYNHTNTVQNGNWPDPEDESTWTDLTAYSDGMNKAQQHELVQQLETTEMGQIESIIQQQDAFWQQHSIQLPNGHGNSWKG